MTARPAKRPVITLTTDFGSADLYVSVMKGVILGICPNAQIVDISHEVPAYDIARGAFLIAQAWRYFPKGTVHVGVVDPGVGTARRPILVELGGQRFVGPDNGLLAMTYSDVDHKARELTNRRYFRSDVSRTFHGRDVFAPVAAHLANGVKPASFGTEIKDHWKSSLHRPQRTSKRLWSGTVLTVDRYGNLITNFPVGEFEDVRTRPFEMAIGMTRVSRLALTFADGQPGEIFAIEGSSGLLEIVENQGSAAKTLGCGVGSPVDLELF
ncbi:MAG: SAM-dependent chlorinase/fluorinase [Bryobacteraceae bacterium]|nr:SAM-dependent chlorinase/fluorinase [Bryobacteraceae bacterium]